MFISTKDKQRIEAQLDAARHQIVILEGRVSILDRQIQEMQKTKKQKTEERNLKQRQYMKAYKERQRLAKLAAQGNTNVST